MADSDQAGPDDWRPLERLLRAAEQGDAAAQFRLGAQYESGDGVHQDASQAAEWYRRSAEQGVAGAQYCLAWLYLRGAGVPQDPATASRWLQAAAEQGLSEAQEALSRLYRRGEGVPRDLVKAQHWMERAAADPDDFKRIAARVARWAISVLLAAIAVGVLLRLLIMWLL
jgi:hypothetical protein